MKEWFPYENQNNLLPRMLSMQPLEACGGVWRMFVFAASSHYASYVLSIYWKATVCRRELLEGDSFAWKIVCVVLLLILSLRNVCCLFKVFIFDCVFHCCIFWQC